MEGINQTAMRDAYGRFMPGNSGNPAGKKPGTRNRATVLREALAEGEDIATARIIIDKALAGDAVAARFIVDRLTPRPRGARSRSICPRAREPEMCSPPQTPPSPRWRRARSRPTRRSPSQRSWTAGCAH
jgi:hypothetical protein